MKIPVVCTARCRLDYCTNVCGSTTVYKALPRCLKAAAFTPRSHTGINIDARVHT